VKIGELPNAAAQRLLAMIAQAMANGGGANPG